MRAIKLDFCDPCFFLLCFDYFILVRFSFEEREVPYVYQKSVENSTATSRLAQWPCQIKLVPVNAPYFEGANLLIAADCSAFAYGNFHNDFMRNHITLIGCPKLDGVDYTEKLTYILKNNNIKSVKIVRMEVPCCGGLENAVKNALLSGGKFIPWQVITISTDGRIICLSGYIQIPD